MRLVRDAVITPERVAALLSRRYPGVEVERVDVLDESEGSASRLALRVTYAAGASAGLPERIFLKRNLAEFTFPPEMYLTECFFYRDVAPELSIETPRVYGLELDEKTGAFTMLMEDLHERGARLGIAREHVTPDEVASVLTTLAALHAAFWDSPRLRTELAWLESPATSRFVRFWRDAGPKLARRHVEGHRGALVGTRSWVHDRAWTAFAALQDDLAAAPRTMLHGDVHVGNVYFVPDAPGGVLDWQLMLQGSWSVDVAYLVMTALDPQQRAACERDLLRSYLAELTRFGVEPPLERDAWELYRRNAVWGVVMWLVTPEGVHADDVQAISLERCMIATEDLDALDALEVR
jgi:aminoglycoside phosphotransferase (APT) family kinase protein